METLKALSFLLLGICIAVIASMLITASIERQQRVDCYKWQEYEKQYTDFQLNAQDIKDCASLGIIIQ